jgi:beta-lactamase regulating signal transducer with metallopeptidase domain
MGEASRLLATLALNATWQLLVLVTAAAAADLLLLRPAPARTRHALWASTVLLAAALPLLAFVPRGAPPVRPAVRLPEAPSLLAAPAVPPAAEAPRRFSVSVPGSAGLALIALLVVAGGLRGSRLLLALRRATRLRRSAREERSEKVHSLALECAEALAISPVPVLSAPGLEGPITVGALRPVILLPPGFASAHDDDAIRAALGHELAHVKRRDYGLNLAFEAALLPFAWHPAAVVLRRRLGETREMACDELASESLLCRLDAELATDPAEARTYLAKADETLAKARQMKASGVTSTAPRADVPMPPPPPPPKKAHALPPPPPPPAR